MAWAPIDPPAMSATVSGEGLAVSPRRSARSTRPAKAWTAPSSDTWSAMGPSGPKPVMLQCTRRPLTKRSRAGARSSRSMTPGRKFSTRTSEAPTKSISTLRPSSDLRSSTTPRRSRCSEIQNGEGGSPGFMPAPALVGSPDGDSTLMTSAPRSARARVTIGPERKVLRSSTVMPANGVAVIAAFDSMAIAPRHPCTTGAIRSHGSACGDHPPVPSSVTVTGPCSLLLWNVYWLITGPGTVGLNVKV